jgi:hypothetical protein
MKKILKKIALLSLVCFFLVVNSVSNNVTFGSYAKSKIADKYQFANKEQGPPALACAALIVAGVAAVAGTLVAVHEAGTVVGRAAYYFFGEDEAKTTPQVEMAYDSTNFTDFDPSN